MAKEVNELSAGIIIYRNTKRGRVYLVLYHGGSYWNFPKGKIENEETAIQAAIREVGEETGIKKRDLKIHNHFGTQDNWTYSRGKGGNKEKVYKKAAYFLARTNKSVIRLTPKEHQGFGWFFYEDAKKILTHKNSQRVLKKADDVLTYHSSRGQQRTQKPSDHL